MTLKVSAVLAGMIAVAVCLFGLFAWFAGTAAHPIYIVNLEPMMIALLIALLLSLFSGFYWTKWLFGVSFLIVAMLLFVGFRLH